MGIIRALFVALCIKATIDTVDSISLSSIKKDYQGYASKISNNKCSLQYTNNVKQQTIGKLATADVYPKQMSKISDNPL